MDRKYSGRRKPCYKVYFKFHLLHYCNRDVMEMHIASNKNI